LSEEYGVGHCGKYCKNWICDEEPKWDDLCVGCPCNWEEEEYWEEKRWEEEDDDMEGE